MAYTQLSPPQADDVSSLIPYAILAPSSHNTQPWRFRVVDNSVYLYADRTKALPANDPDDRELTISCGCAAMNLRIAAAHAGLATHLEILPHSENDELLAVASFSNASDTVLSDAELFRFIVERRTYRKRFTEEAISDVALQRLTEAATAEQAWLQVLEHESDRHCVSELVSEGDAMQWANPSWRRELAAWMHPRRKGDGLPVPWLVAPFAQVVVRTFDMGNGIGAKDKELAEQSPVLAVLGTARDAPSDWFVAGQGLERVLLTACQNGLQASYLNQAVQIPSLRTKLQHSLHCDGYPQIVLRLGFPSETLPTSPRRNALEVIDKV
ncbi:MAG: nitroreductase [Planctomycetota bacterium]|nr:nitroreductase [Planctomycetota bacterium]MDA1179254.1 nitroreductase [Planctomycetota bacterium]